MKTATQPLVSVVTPVYNEAGYLAECIESVLRQTYQNWEYTVVDNCSTDGSLEVALRYAAKDHRVRVYQNDRRLDAIPNHNVALRQISPASKYCKVVFGDDWIFPNCLEQMVAVAEEYPSMGIVGAYALEGERVAWAGLPYPSPFVPGREICRRHLLEGLYVFGSANAVLYRADLVRSRDPFYNEANIHADTEVCFALLSAADFGFVHQVLTFTRVRPHSLNTAANNLHTYLAGMLRLLVTYAPEYLSHEERENCLSHHMSRYYTFLGKSMFMSRGKNFWHYHRENLTKIGVGFSRPRLVKGMLAALYDAVLRPTESLGRLLQGRQHRGLAVRNDGFEGKANFM